MRDRNNSEFNSILIEKTYLVKNKVQERIIEVNYIKRVGLMEKIK